MLKIDRKYAFFIAFLSALLTAALSYADTVTLNSGQVHEGEITAEEDSRIQIKLEGSGVRLWFPRDQLESFQKTERKAEEGGESSGYEEETPALDDDATRAREMLEKLRADQKSNPQKKTKRKRSKKSRKKKSTKSTAGSSNPGQHTGELIEQMRNGKSIAVRINACRQLGKTRDMDAVPHLIHVLDDDTPAMRSAANKSLIAITDQNFGFKGTDKRNVRLLGIKKWEEWYKNLYADESKNVLKSFWQK